MTKEEIIKELDKLGNVLYNKFGTDSYLERCTIHDLKDRVKALTLTDVVSTLVCDIEKGTRCKDSFPDYKDGKCRNCGGQAN